MLGRVRASPVWSLEELEMERQPPKITKQDSLSIYEATLLKLKQGSRRVPSMDEESAMAIDGPEVATMPVDADSSTVDSCGNSGISFQSTCSLKQSEGKNMSILSFFSKCKSTPHAQGSADEEQASRRYNSPSSSSSVSAISADS